jgi:IS1 family transposase
MFGVRDLATVQRLKTKLKQLGIHYTRIASDHWAFHHCFEKPSKIGNFLL